jgi:hypothetical protein
VSENGKDKKGDEDMLARVHEASASALRKPRRKRTSLLSSATDETFKEMNELTKRNRGLSNLTYKDLDREE